MTEPRPHRDALAPEQAADAVRQEAGAGRLDAGAVAAVLGAAGHRRARIERPAGLTEREAEVIGLLARGLQTKQVARALGISVKTADRHVQNACDDRRADPRGGGAVRDAARAGEMARLPIGRSGAGS